MVLEVDVWVGRFNVRSFGNLQHMNLFTLSQRIHGPNIKFPTNLSDSKRDQMVLNVTTEYSNVACFWLHVYETFRLFLIRVVAVFTDSILRVSSCQYFLGEIIPKKDPYFFQRTLWQSKSDFGLHKVVRNWLLFLTWKYTFPTFWNIFDRHVMTSRSYHRAPLEK